MSLGVGLDCLAPIYLKTPSARTWNFEDGGFLRVRCNRCINCKAFNARQWTLRLAMESKYWKDLCFVTLTYSDDNVPINYVSDSVLSSITDGVVEGRLVPYYTFNKTHLRDYLKRLRKALGYPIRYYAVHEYGSNTHRPHIHILFFGIKSDDYSKIGFTLDEWTKQRFEHYSAWNYGYVDIRPFFPETCNYIAGYVQKKLYGEDMMAFSEREFLRCSQHLGEQWIMDNLSLFDDEHAYINYQGYKYAIPRTFRKKLVKLGILSEFNQYDLISQQLVDYTNLKLKLWKQGLEMADFFKQRYKNAKVRESRLLSSRSKNKDI